MPAVPWQSPGPFPWPPACQVSSAPARKSSSGKYEAAEMTIPGAPWHHCTRIEPSGSTSAGRPVGERPLDDRRALEHLGDVACVLDGRALEERELVSDGAVGRAEQALLSVTEALRPESVRATPAPKLVGALRPGVAPTLLTGPRVHRVRGEHRSGCAPRELVRLVVHVLAHAREQSIGQLVARCEAKRHREDSGFAAEQAGVARCRLRRVVGVVRSVLPQLERAERRAGEVDADVCVAAAAQRVERERHACRAGVEILDRRLGVGEVSLVRRPEVVGIERGLGVRDDRADRFTNALGVPRVLGQRLEVFGAVEHRASPSRRESGSARGRRGSRRSTARRRRRR